MEVGKTLEWCDFETNVYGGVMKKKVSNYSMWQESLLTFAEHCVVPALS